MLEKRSKSVAGKVKRVDGTSTSADATKKTRLIEGRGKATSMRRLAPAPESALRGHGRDNRRMRFQPQGYRQAEPMVAGEAGGRSQA